MKYLPFLFLFLGLWACNEQTPVSDEKVEEAPEEIEEVMLSPNLEIFLTKFKTAVENHDAEACLNYFNEEYKEEQIEFLNGNIEQFLNEFFCGQTQDGAFQCFEFDSIEQIETEVIEDTGYSISVSISVVNFDGTKIKFQSTIYESGGDWEESYGFIGAVG